MSELEGITTTPGASKNIPRNTGTFNTKSAVKQVDSIAACRPVDSAVSDIVEPTPIYAPSADQLLSSVTAPAEVVGAETVTVKKEVKEDIKSTDAEKIVSAIENNVVNLDTLAVAKETIIKVEEIKKEVVDMKDNVKTLETLEKQEVKLEKQLADQKQVLEDKKKAIQGKEQRMLGVPEDSDIANKIKNEAVTIAKEAVKTQTDIVKTQSELKNVKSNTKNLKVKNAMIGEDIVEKIQIVEAQVDAPSTKDKVAEIKKAVTEISDSSLEVKTVCACDYAHSITKISDLVPLNAAGNQSTSEVAHCIGLVSYQENDQMLTGAMRCAPKNNSCTSVTFDVNTCEVRPFKTLNSKESLVTNLKTIFNM